MLILVYDYIDVTQFDNYVFIPCISWFRKHSSNSSSISVTLFVLRRWRVVCAAGGGHFGAVWGSESAAGGFVLGLCVGVCGCVCVWVCMCMAVASGICSYGTSIRSAHSIFDSVVHESSYYSMLYVLC
jgi:hypothetical protein